MRHSAATKLTTKIGANNWAEVALLHKLNKVEVSIALAFL